MAATGTQSLSAEAKKPRRGRHAMWIVLLLVLLAAFVPPYINVSRYKLRVVDLLSRALGRNVTVSSIEMRLLPRPGVVLSNFVAADDPSYSPEPLLRADSVAAYLHLSSLWRGRLEIGTLELDTPSLNLVRRNDGHWNIEELLQRTSWGATAPTAAAHSGARARFPYVEASGGRINFKFGQVKKAFAFTEADFALWLESENEWGVRLKGRPMRTDLELSDTGQLQVDGRFRRAALLRDTPISLKASFTRGQLGQLTKLVYGRDRGWRGGTLVNGSLTGTPAALAVVLDAQVHDFRRYDIALGESLLLQAHCTGNYSVEGEQITDVVCESPVKPGALRLTGNASQWGATSYQIAIDARQLPMSRLIAFARHVKKDLPPDLDATGEADAAFEVRKLEDGVQSWSGGGQTSHLALQSKVLSKELSLGQIEFSVPGGPLPAVSPRRKSKLPPAAIGFALVVKPFPLAMGGTAPAVVSGFFDEDNYRATLGGPAELTRLLEVASAFGIGSPAIGLKGDSEVELELAGPWMGFTPPATSGQMKIKHAIAELQGVNEPLQIASASATLRSELVSIDSFTGSFASGPALEGSVSFPMQCNRAAGCRLQFNLHANELPLWRVNQLLNPSLRSQPWYHLLSLGKQKSDFFLTLPANGVITVARVPLGPVVATNVNARLEMNAGKVQLDVLRSDVLGGHNAGHWSADFTRSPPRYAGGGAFLKVSMDQLSAAMKDGWAAGLASGKYGVTLQGTTAASLRDSLTGSLDFAWTAGSLRHVTLAGHPGPLAFSSFTGLLDGNRGKLALKNCGLNSGGASYTVTGTATLDRTLDLRLEREGGPSYAISGSLETPRVEALPAGPTQAKLR
jgi:hypothetical protein